MGYIHIKAICDYKRVQYYGIRSHQGHMWLQESIVSWDTLTSRPYVVRSEYSIMGYVHIKVICGYKRVQYYGIRSHQGHMWLQENIVLWDTFTSKPYVITREYSIMGYVHIKAICGQKRVQYYEIRSHQGHLWLQESIVLWDMFTSRPYVITREYSITGYVHIKAICGYKRVQYYGIRSHQGHMWLQGNRVLWDTFTSSPYVITREYSIMGYVHIKAICGYKRVQYYGIRSHQGHMWLQENIVLWDTFTSRPYVITREYSIMGYVHIKAICGYKRVQYYGIRSHQGHMWLQESIVLWDTFTSRPYVITREYSIMGYVHIKAICGYKRVQYYGIRSHQGHMWLQESIVLWDTFTSRPYVVTREYSIMGYVHIKAICGYKRIQYYGIRSHQIHM